jgi:hypothetical protein
MMANGEVTMRGLLIEKDEDGQTHFGVRAEEGAHVISMADRVDRPWLFERTWHGGAAPTSEGYAAPAG